MLSPSASINLPHEMPSAKVCPMKCGPDCRQSECNPTAVPPTAIRKQSNSSCSSSSVNTTVNSNNSNNSTNNSHQSNSASSAAAAANPSANASANSSASHSTAINHNSINNSSNSNHSNNSNGNSLSNSMSLCNNLNTLNSNQSNLIYDSNLNSLNNCPAIKHSVPICTKACCSSRNTHLNSSTLKQRHSTSSGSSATARYPIQQQHANTTAAVTNTFNQTNGSLCACCSPATNSAMKTGLRLHSNSTKCTDQCFINNKPSANSSNQCCNGSLSGCNQTAAAASINSNNSQSNGQTKAHSLPNHTVPNNTQYDHLLNQSPQSCQIMLDNDKAFGGEFQIFSSTSSSSLSLSTDQAYTFSILLKLYTFHYTL